jgi:hypothetical protein
LPIFNKEETPLWSLLVTFFNPRIAQDAVNGIAIRLSREPMSAHDDLPWSIDFDAAMRAINRLSDHKVMADLAFLLNRFTKTTRSGRFLAEVLTGVDIRKRSEVLGRCNKMELEVLAQHLGRSDKALLGRGRTFRAIIDGSNVMCATRDISKVGGEPKIERVIQLRDRLRENGFTEIVIFFDRGGVTNRLSHQDRTSLNGMVNNREASMVHQADSVILQKYLEDPDVSEVISDDNFVSDVRENTLYKDIVRRLEEVGLSRRFFFLDQNHEIVVRPSLEFPALRALGKDVWQMNRQL